MSILIDQIRKAEDRLGGMNIATLVRDSKDKPPSAMATPKAQSDRYQLLMDTYGDNAETQTTFERIIAGDELQPVNYLAHGVIAARPVCRLNLQDPGGYATGFLVAPGVLLTNNHVFPSAASAGGAVAEFDLELDVFDRPKPSVVFRLNPERLYLTSTTLDFSVVAVEATNQQGASLEKFGFLPLIEAPGKAVEGEWLTIIQHPAGGKKSMCIRENKLISRTDDVLWYATDTMPGSSGSPVYNNDWQVVALHHSGVPDKKNNVIQTLDGRNYDPGRDPETSIKWIANEGIRVSRLVEELRQLKPDEPLLEPVFGMTAARAQSLTDSFAAALPSASPAVAVSSPPPADTRAAPITTVTRSLPAMTPRTIQLTLDVADDGAVTVRQSGSGATESYVQRLERSDAAPDERPPEYDVPFSDDYSAKGKRKGYNARFLDPRKGAAPSNLDVPLPVLGPLAQDAAKPSQAGPNGDHVLDYMGYSLVMHAKRKLAIYTAANVDGENRVKLGRPHDQWRYDPRIPRTSQIGDYYYAHNQFDRGHLTRYEDMQYGAALDALETAADTLHFTNCTPQHAKFNQGKQLWQGLEQHILEQSIKSQKFAAQIFTGPVLDPGDPVWEKYKDIQYPLQFWKIAVALTSENKLFAAAFILDQSDVIAQFGIEATVEVPFSAFKTYQVPVAEVERRTGLEFTAGSNGDLKLSAFDPLKSGSPARTLMQRVKATESTSVAPPPGYVPLASRQDIVLR